MSDFSFIKDNCNESKMFRNNYLSGMTLRDAADSAFLNLIALYVLYKEFETSPYAQNYAQKTIAYGNFIAPRVSGTDLYQALHIVCHPDNETASKLKGSEQNSVMAQKLHVQEKMCKDFLRGMATGTLERTTAIRLMYRLEGQMFVNLSNYKSLRRLVTDWENLTTFQKQICVTRLLQYYHTRARRSDLLPVFENLARNKGWILDGVTNAEINDIGPANAIHSTSSSSSFLSTMAKSAAGFTAGYIVGKHMFKPVKM